MDRVEVVVKLDHDPPAVPLQMLDRFDLVPVEWSLQHDDVGVGRYHVEQLGNLLIARYSGDSLSGGADGNDEAVLATPGSNVLQLSKIVDDVDLSDDLTDISVDRRAAGGVDTYTGDALALAVIVTPTSYPLA